MPSFILQPSARLMAQVRDDIYTTTEQDIERVNGKKYTMLEMPRVGEVLFWPDGYSVEIDSIAWPMDEPGKQRLPLIHVF